MKKSSIAGLTVAGISIPAAIGTAVILSQQSEATNEEVKDVVSEKVNSPEEQKPSEPVATDEGLKATEHQVKAPEDNKGGEVVSSTTIKPEGHQTYSEANPETEKDLREEIKAHYRMQRKIDMKDQVFDCWKEKGPTSSVLETKNKLNDYVKIQKIQFTELKRHVEEQCKNTSLVDKNSYKEINKKYEKFTEELKNKNLKDLKKVREEAIAHIKEKEEEYKNWMKGFVEWIIKNGNRSQIHLQSFYSKIREQIWNKK